MEKKIGVGAKGSGISSKEGEVKSRIYVLCHGYCGSICYLYEGERNK